MEIVFLLALGGLVCVGIAAYRQKHAPYRGLQWRIYRDGNGAYALEYRPLTYCWDFPTIERRHWYTATEGAEQNRRYATLENVTGAIAYYEHRIAEEHHAKTWQLIEEKMPGQPLKVEAIQTARQRDEAVRDTAHKSSIKNPMFSYHYVKRSDAAKWGEEDHHRSL